MRAAFATGAYLDVAPGTPTRQCKDLYLEKVETDPQRPLKLVKRPGSVALPDWVGGVVRGCDQTDGFADGKLLFVIGATLQTYDLATGTVATIAGSIAGTDRVQFAFTSRPEVAILGGGILHFSLGVTVAAATDVDFPANITSVQSIEQRFIFSYGAAGRFGYTEVLVGDNTTSISYYTAEYAPDGLIAGFVLGARILLFGTKTLEEWYPTGDNDNPFRRGSGRVTETGCLCRDAIRKVDNTAYWLDENCSVRRLGGAETPEIVSSPDLSQYVTDATTSQIVAMDYQVKGQSFYILRLPDAPTYAYSPNIGQWHTRQTNLTDTWRYGYILTASKKQYVADFDGVGFAEMSLAYQSEHMPDVSTMGTEIVPIFTVYASITGDTLEIYSVRLEGAKGQGLATGQGSEPVWQMRKWKGDHWSSWRSRSSGRQGQYDARSIWRRVGQAGPPGLWMEFMMSDPVVATVDGVVINED